MSTEPTETRVVITSWQAMRLGAGLVIGVVFAPVVLVVEAAGWVISTRRRGPRS